MNTQRITNFRADLCLLSTTLFFLAFSASAMSEEVNTESKPNAIDTPSKVWINFGGISLHAYKNSERNSQNEGLGVEYVLDERKSLIAGVYKNSFYTYSQYAGMTWMPIEFGRTRLGLIGGVINGYQMIRKGDFFPAVMPQLTFEGRHHGLNLIVAPPSYGKMHGSLALQYKYRF